MALAMNVRANAVAAPVVAAGIVPSLKPASSSARFTIGAAPFKRASLVVVRAESKVEPGPGGRGNTSGPPTTPAGMSGSEAPLGVVSKSAPLDQGSEVPVSDRVAYVCQECGFVYKDETPFEKVPESYNCPECQAPKSRIIVTNATVGETEETSM